MSPRPLVEIDAERIAAAVRPFRGRSVDAARPVRVYRNLSNRGGRWSILQRGIVVAHADALMLRDAVFVISAAGLARLLRLGRKVVCAYAEGLMIGSGMGITATEGKPLPAHVTFDASEGRFVCRNIVITPRTIHGARVALFRDRVTAAYSY